MRNRPANKDSNTRRSAAVLGAAAAFLAVCAAPHLLPTWTINHDAAWFVHAARGWLAGQRLYIDLVDPNLPLATYLTALPVACAEWTGAPVLLAFNGFVIGLVAISVACIDAALRRGDTALEPLHRAALLGAIIYTLTLLPGSDFGQREHLLAILLLPWAITTALRHPVPWMLGLATGALASLGIGLKPHFLAVPLGLIVAYTIARARGLTRSGFAAADVGLGIGLLAQLIYLVPWTGGAGAAFRETIGLARATYSGFDAPLGSILTSTHCVEAMILGGTLLFAPRQPTMRALHRRLSAIWFALLVIAIAQHKGWSYHFLSASTFGHAALAIALISCTGPRLLGSAIALLIGAAGLGAVQRSDSGLRPTIVHPHDLAHAETLRTLSRNGAAMAIDTSAAPHLAAFLYTGMTSTSRFACLWPLAGSIPGNPSSPQAAYVRAAVAEDLRHGAPDLVIAKKPPLFMMPNDFDPLDWLMEAPEFAHLWTNYSVAMETTEFMLYKRHP